MATQTGQPGTTSACPIEENEERQNDIKYTSEIKDDKQESSEIAADSASIKNDGSLSHSCSSESSVDESDLELQKSITSNNGTHSNNNTLHAERTTSHTWRSRMNSFTSAEEIQLFYTKQQETHLKRKLFRKSSSDALAQDTNLLDRVPLKKGYLYWLDKKKGKWTLRWFELSGGILMHYHSQHSELIEMISLEEDPVTLQEHDNAKIPFCFEIITVTDELILRAESDKEMHSWLNEIVKHRFLSHTKNTEKDSAVPTFKSIAIQNEEDPKPNLGPPVTIHTHTLRKSSSRQLPPVSDTISDPGKVSRKFSGRIRTSRSAEHKSRSRAQIGGSSSAPGTLHKSPTAPLKPSTSKSKGGIFKMMPSLSAKNKSRAVTVSSAPALKTAASMFQARDVARSVSDSELANILLNQGPNIRVTWNEVSHKFPRGWKPPKPKEPKPPPPSFPNPNPKYRSRRGTEASYTSGTSSNENDSKTTDESNNDSSSTSSEITDDSKSDVDVPQSKPGQGRTLTKVPSTASSPAKLQS